MTQANPFSFDKPLSVEPMSPDEAVICERWNISSGRAGVMRPPRERSLYRLARFNDYDGSYPCAVSVISDGPSPLLMGAPVNVRLSSDMTHFLVSLRNRTQTGLTPSAVLHVDGAVVSLVMAGYACVASRKFRLHDPIVQLQPGADALVVSIPYFHGRTVFGGELENYGRCFTYDGCSETFLIPPDVEGDPSLRHLHVPGGTKRKAFSVGTVQIGMVMRGAGWLAWGNGASSSLDVGDCFVVPAGVPHALRTDNAVPLDVALFHPSTAAGGIHSPLALSSAVAETGGRAPHDEPWAGPAIIDGWKGTRYESPDAPRLLPMR